MRRLFIALLSVTLLSRSAVAADLDILPVDKPVSARVMQLAAAPEIVKITERFSAAAARRPEWFVAYAKEYKDTKGALPYHVNMGISQNDYRRMIESSKTLKLMQMGTVQLSVAKQAGGGLRLQTRPVIPGLDGVIFETGGQAVTTRSGRLAQLSQIDNRDVNAPTGRWTGTQWRHESRSASRALSVKLALGKRVDHGDGILYLDVSDVGEGKKDIFYEILLFPLGQ